MRYAFASGSSFAPSPSAALRAASAAAPMTGVTGDGAPPGVVIASPRLARNERICDDAAMDARTPINSTWSSAERMDATKSSPTTGSKSSSSSAAAAAASSPVSLTDAPRARSSEGIGVRAAPPPAFPSAGRSSSSSESHTESSSFLGCDDDVDDGSWPPSPSGVSGTTPGLPPVASSDSNRARSARSWSIVPPRARPCCAERRSGRAAVKFKYPAKMVRPAPAVG